MDILSQMDPDVDQSEKSNSGSYHCPPDMFCCLLNLLWCVLSLHVWIFQILGTSKKKKPNRKEKDSLRKWVNIVQGLPFVFLDRQSQVSKAAMSAKVKKRDRDRARQWDRVKTGGKKKSWNCVSCKPESYVSQLVVCEEVKITERVRETRKSMAVAGKATGK